jgi:hypothetical protein
LIRLTARLSLAAQESKGGRNMRVSWGSSSPFFWPETGGSLMHLRSMCYDLRFAPEFRAHFRKKSPGSARAGNRPGRTAELYSKIRYIPAPRAPPPLLGAPCRTPGSRLAGGLLPRAEKGEPSEGDNGDADCFRRQFPRISRRECRDRVNFRQKTRELGPQ